MPLEVTTKNAIKKLNVAELTVYEAAAAPLTMASWLRSILQPVITAAKLPSIPVEVRQTGRWAGWCGDRDEAPDGRIALSKKIAFWDAEKIIHIYLHEATHRLLNSHVVQAHGPEFLCVNAILLIRCSVHFSDDSRLKLNLYDFSDQPKELENAEFWRGEVLDWALKTAHELATTETAAEKLVAVVCTCWQQHIKDAARDRQKAANADARQAAELVSLRSSQKLCFFLALTGWGCFLFLSFHLFIN